MYETHPEVETSRLPLLVLASSIQPITKMKWCSSLPDMAEMPHHEQAETALEFLTGSARNIPKFGTKGTRIPRARSLSSQTSRGQSVDGGVVGEVRGFQ